MIYFCAEPGLPYPLFSTGLAKAMTDLGFPAKAVEIGSRKVSSVLLRMESTPLWRIARSGRAFALTHFSNGSLLSTIGPGDIVVVYETFGMVCQFDDCRFHRQVKEKGARLVSVVPDAWPLVPFPLQNHACDSRVQFADTAGAVTPELAELLKRKYPAAHIVLMEEAVDTDNFCPDFERNEPVVIWSGPPPKLTEVEQTLPVLEAVFKERPFRLRLCCGRERPILHTCIPVDWVPFFGSSRIDQFAGATIAFARYLNYRHDYARCKGNYKIKTYLAAGCAVLSDPVGYNTRLVHPGTEGFLPKNDGEWKSSLEMLLSNRELLARMRKNARAAAVECFSFRAVAAQYADVLGLKCRGSGELTTKEHRPSSFDFAGNA